jgi:hypothetical protein
VRAALGELRAEVTRIDVPNEIRWHHRLGCLVKLTKIKLYLNQLLDEPLANLRATSREFATRLLDIGIGDCDDLGDLVGKLGPMVDLFVTTFPVPIKQLEFAKLHNCALHRAARACTICGARSTRRSRRRTRRWASGWHLQRQPGCSNARPWSTGS